MNDCPFEDIHQHLLTHVCARFAESEAPGGVEFKCSFKGTVFQCRSWYILATKQLLATIVLHVGCFLYNKVIIIKRHQKAT